MDYDKPGDDDNIVNEPQLHYGMGQNMKLHIFTSFDEAERANAAEAAKQPPLERIKETVELILRVYGVTREQLMANRKKLHLTIIDQQ